MKYKNIIWDWNGTILNDTPVAVEATNILLQRFGYPTITLEYYRDNVDTPIVNFYSKIFDLNKHDVEMIDDEWGMLYNQLSEKIDLHAGIKEMLCFFADKNFNQIILSAFKTIEITKFARMFSIEHYFDDILVTQNIVMESKTVRGRRYMLQHGFAPKQTLYIGDTVHDYETARGLGVDCILFSGGQQSPKLLKQCGVPVYDTFADIANQLIVVNL
ncbi:MAG: HAD family hydrolase [Methanobrevibacter sp.]|nr:HAD family hydrolase [Methanobrevibacter sp.]